MIFLSDSGPEAQASGWWLAAPVSGRRPTPAQPPQPADGGARSSGAARARKRRATTRTPALPGSLGPRRSLASRPLAARAKSARERAAGDPRGIPLALLAPGPAHPELPGPDPRRSAGRPPAPRAPAAAQRALSAAPRARDAQRRHQQARGAPSPAPGRGSTCAAQGRRGRTREAARDPHARRPEIHPLTNPRGGATVSAARPTTGSKKEGPFSAPETGSPEVMVHSAPSPLVARIWVPKTDPLFSTATGCARAVEKACPRNSEGGRPSGHSPSMELRCLAEQKDAGMQMGVTLGPRAGVGASPLEAPKPESTGYSAPSPFAASFSVPKTDPLSWAGASYE